MPPKFRGQPRKANGEFASKGGGSGKSKTHTSSGVTGTFKTYKKAAKSSPLLPQKNSKGQTTYANAAGGRISQTDAAARMFGTGSKQHKAALAKARKKK